MHNKSSLKGLGRLWPTPQAHDAQSPKTPEQIQVMREMTGAGVKNLNEVVKLWPTMTAHCCHNRQTKYAQGGTPLTLAVTQSSGQTSANSMEPITEESTCLQVDFLASLSVAPGSAEARQMTARSGRKCSELLRSQSPLGALLKTCLESSEWNSTACFLTWKASVTKQGRLLFRLAPSMPRTDGTECGLWPTPNVPNGDRTMSEQDVIKKGMTDKGKRQVMLENAVRFWPTPGSAPAGPDFAKTQRSSTGLSLETKAALYPTPDANCFKGGSENQRRGQLNGSLNPTWVELLMGYPAGWTETDS